MMDASLVSRVENILRQILGEEANLEKPRSRVEELLYALMDFLATLESATLWIGVTTTPITDGSTVTTVVVAGQSITVQTGYIVSYDGTEYIYNGSIWQEFGRTYSDFVTKSGLLTALGQATDNTMTQKAITDELLKKLESISVDTNTSLLGVLCGDGSKVYSKSIDTKPTEDSENLITSGGVSGAIKEAMTHVCYGFHIDKDESDPDARVTYLADAIGLSPAYMDYTNDKFVYGSWKDAFFMPRPCMVKYDGTVDYYLDPDDYTKKLDGTASDVGNLLYNGNAMMEFGQNHRKIWMKVVPDEGETTSGSVYIADYKVDPDFEAYSFINHEDDDVEHFYFPIYNGSLDANNKLRSISGQAIMQSKTASQENTYAANNNDEHVIWTNDLIGDRMLINFLLILMSKSTNMQDKFGNGIETGSQTAANDYRTGALNAKGLFYGSNGSSTAVKVFGIENYWGLQWDRVQGYLNVNGTQKVKMTYGMRDGSTGTGFDLTGSGFLSIDGSTPTGTSGSYIDSEIFTPYGMFCKNSGATGSSDTKYYCDAMWFNNSITAVALFGGVAASGRKCGPFCVFLYNTAGDTSWGIGARVSCRPLAVEGE